MLLEVNNLNIQFKTDLKVGKKTKLVPAVMNLSFSLEEKKILGVVGESGSGKSITNLALLNLLPDTAIVTADRLKFNGKNLLHFKEKEWNRFRGKEMAMIFQDPMTALNPFLTVGYQLKESLYLNNKLTKKEAHQKSLELLSQVGINSPEERLKAYPFELSGGMAQRVMIAMALALNPLLLIADEPTTALDVTIQKQILDLLVDLKEEKKMAMILVTHDLGLVAQYSDEIQIMYAGEIIEKGPTKELIKRPLHPYTQGLLNSRPGLLHDQPKTTLPSIKGVVPSFIDRPKGCQFHPRCEYKKEACTELPVHITDINKEHATRCLFTSEVNA